MDNFQFNENIKHQLQNAAYWTLFMSIMGFIGVGIMVIAGFFIMLSTPWFGIIYLVLAGLYYIPSQYLYSFSQKMTSSLKDNTQEDFELAFENLTSFWRFIGVCTIIYLAFLIGALLLAVLFS